MSKHGGTVRAGGADLPDPERLREQFLLWMRMRNCSGQTCHVWRYQLKIFLRWCDARGMRCVSQVTADVLAAYRRYLFHYRNEKTHRPLKFATQYSYLMSVKRWFAWLAEAGMLSENPAARLELPKEEKRLPATVLTLEQVEAALAAADVASPLGLRDRTMLEVLYSTAIRGGELAALEVYDLELPRGVLTIRQGKGRKDRTVPLGARAARWLEKYLADVRPQLVARSGTSRVFVSCHGRPLDRNNLSALVRRYLRAAGVTQRGACHLLRHTAATLMMENGADLRSLQLLLGHERLNTTQLYTHVSIQRLQEVHRRTHPAECPPEDRRISPDSAGDADDPESPP